MILIKSIGSKYERNLPAPILDREITASASIASVLTLK